MPTALAAGIDQWKQLRHGYYKYRDLICAGDCRQGFSDSLGFLWKDCNDRYLKASSADDSVEPAMLKVPLDIMPHRLEDSVPATPTTGVDFYKSNSPRAVRVKVIPASSANTQKYRKPFYQFLCCEQLPRAVGKPAEPKHRNGA